MRSRIDKPTRRTINHISHSLVDWARTVEGDLLTEVTNYITPYDEAGDIDG